MKKFIASIQINYRWTFFTLILLTIGIIGTIMSVVTHFTLIKDDAKTRPQIAIVIPSNSEMGVNFKQGVQLYVDALNNKGGHNERLVDVLEIDETVDAAEKIVADKRVIGVVGYLNPEILKQSASVYEKNHVPLVTPLFLPEAIENVTSLGIDPKDQARFVANYARNIQQQRLMYVVREEGTEFDSLVDPFVEVYQRFDIPVKKVWTIPKGENSDAELTKVLSEIKNIDIGAIYIVADSDLSGRLVKGIRDTGNSLELYGTSQLASNAFSSSVSKTLTKKDAASLTHGIIAASPVLFDTANEKAQNFQRYYQEKYGQSPDWLATYAYDAAKISLSSKPGEDEVKGILGELNFVNRQAQIPIQMGIYSGERLISAPVQLLPIAKGANFNYIEALRQGRVLYVNDRFMFKTNVVYVGVKVNEISDLDFQKETASIDMTIWFRYRGDFAPQDLHIFNSVEPIVLESPDEINGDNVQYLRYRLKQKFKFNFTDAKRAYGQHVAGISFRHRELNRNNVMYVVDVLGMPTGHDLIADLHKRKVLKSNTGWAIDDAWESQDIVTENSDGAPQYVGLSGEKPLFSKITLGMLIKPTTSARDIIPSEYFIYIAIFGILGAIFAVMMDLRRWGRFWSMQSWILRLIFWPLILLSLGNLTLDWAFTKLSPSITITFVSVYESLWWLLGALLLDIGVRRFVWEPLAQYSSSKVPNVIKLFVSILIFAFAFSGMLVFVFNQSPTSLLATSGVLAMVIGMAIKDIIANVFSGIILNFERPFKVGDKIKINTVTGVVTDITWRTTRVESSEGHMVSLANGKVTEAFMENYSQTPNGVSEDVHFYTKPDTDPIEIITIIHDALLVFCNDTTQQNPSVKYKGIVNVSGDWVADFQASYRLDSSGKKATVRENLWIYIHQKFVERGISLLPSNEKLPLLSKN